jgi:CxxC motif-containing protein (DUF1111 family)
MDAHGAPAPEPTYGDQLANSAVQGVRAEGQIVITYREVKGRFISDGAAFSLRHPRYTVADLAYGPIHADAMISPRIAQQLPGVGLLEAIPETEVVRVAEEQSRRTDKIHGITNWVWDAVSQNTVLGRFGWKANVGSLAHQVSAAFNSDMGITSSIFPNESCTASETDCLSAPHGNRGAAPEIDDRTLSNVIFFQALLAPVARRDIPAEQSRRGQMLFGDAKCDVCHHPRWVTGPPPYPSYSSPALTGQTIYPYTDLLLHDMGESLSDNRNDFLASGRQWRTPPLWGIGLIPEVNGHQYLLHDGRARGVLEAILWHGGEASESQQMVLRMPARDRSALVRFVNSL